MLVNKTTPTSGTYSGQVFQNYVKQVRALYSISTLDSYGFLLPDTLSYWMGDTINEKDVLMGKIKGSVFAPLFFMN